MRKPLVPIAKADVRAGAWRVKWHFDASRSTDLLVACMHDGFKIIRFSSSVLRSESNMEDADWSIMKAFNAHESLAYGVDWARLRQSGTEDTIVASCSFYDHVLHTWAG